MSEPVPPVLIVARSRNGRTRYGRPFEQTVAGFTVIVTILSVAE